MSRFKSIVQNLREIRSQLIEENRKKKERKSSKGSKKKAQKFTFDSPELEKLFNSLPEDMRKTFMKGK